MATMNDVLHAVDAALSEADRPIVLEALQGYLHQETVRVKLAILVLADGDLGEVDRLVARANMDYRDLLYWAEYPEESKAGSKKEMAAQYRRLGVPVPPALG